MKNPKQTFSLDVEKLRRDVEREIRRIKQQTVDEFSLKEREQIGNDVIDLMKDQIARGVSPIAGWGRFPGYKWVERGNQLLKTASSLKGKSFANQRKTLRSKAASTKKRGYPYTVQKKYPDKKTRPVNLKLSGRFLDALQSKGTWNGLEIGFYKEPYKSYELGHRTGGKKGVNDQPERPIIPQGSETFTRNIYQRLVDSVRYRIADRIAKMRKG